MIKYIFFDLDGTLTDPKEGITKSIKYALDFFGYEVKSLDELIPFIGPPLEKSFQEYYGMDVDKSWDAVKKMRERFSTVGLFENRIYDGVLDMLSKLKDNGKILALATSKPEEYAVRIVERYGILPYLTITTGSDFEGLRTAKAAVILETLKRLNLTEEDKDSIIMVGDRLHDIEGAHQCGIKAVGCYFGYAKANELEEAGADYIVHSMEELEKLLLSL